MRKKTLLISLFLIAFLGAGFKAAHAQVRGDEMKGEKSATFATLKMADDEQYGKRGPEYVTYRRDRYYSYYPYYGRSYRYRDPYYYGYRYRAPYYGDRYVNPYYGPRYDYRYPGYRYYDGRSYYNFSPRRYDHGHYRYYYRGYWD